MNAIIIRIARLASVAILGTMLFGCVTLKMPPATVSVDNQQKLHAAALAPAKAGTFALAVGKPADMDKSQGGMRGSSMEPLNGSFAQTLRDQLVMELKAAGLYDDAATAVISGELTQSELDAAIGTGTGRLGAHFSVVRDGKKVYDKELVADAKWESSFMGPVAIPAAMNQYAALYRTLVGQLFADPDFQHALAR